MTPHHPIKLPPPLSTMPRPDSKHRRQGRKPAAVVAKGAKKGGAGGGEDDDSSLDSRGNVRNLIDYDYEDEEEASESSDEGATPPPPSPGERPAKIKAVRRLRRLAAAEEEDTAASSGNAASSAEGAAAEAVVARPGQRRPRAVLEEGDDEAGDDVEAPAPVKPAKKARAEDGGAAAAKPAAGKDKGKEEKTKVVLRRRRRRAEESSSEEEEEEDDGSENSDDEEEDSDDEEDSDEESSSDSSEEEGRKRRSRRRRAHSDDDGGMGPIITMLSAMDDGPDPMKPIKYKMKNEPPAVRRFVRLVQKQQEEEEEGEHIDRDITYFKSLPADKQASLLETMERRSADVAAGSEATTGQAPLKFRILQLVAAQPQLQRLVMAKYAALNNIDPSTTEYYKCDNWIKGFCNLPLGVYRDLPVKIEDGAEKCGEFMGRVQACMESAIYGHEEAKLQIMQFVSAYIANPQATGRVLAIHGPPGTGKTSLVKDGIAKALGRPFHMVSLGGATDASYLDGHSYTYEGSTWGRIVEVLMQSKCMNPIIYFDELDKVSDTPKGEEINNLLIHLTDSSQNDSFQDKYFSGINLDLSRCLFIFSHNNNEKVNPILRDRMYNIRVEGFNVKQKLIIAEQYLLQVALKEVDLYQKVGLSSDVLQYIVEEFTGTEPGVRELKRCLQTIAAKLNLLRFYNNPKQVPFAIPNFTLPFTVRRAQVDLLLKRKETVDASISHLYT